MIISLCGNSVCPLALAAAPGQDARCVGRAFAAGLNFFFFYGPGNVPFIEQLALLAKKDRDRLVIATGSGARKNKSLLTVRRKITAALKTEIIDIFFAEYVNPADAPESIFGD